MSVFSYCPCLDLKTCCSTRSSRLFILCNSRISCLNVTTVLLFFCVCRVSTGRGTEVTMNPRGTRPNYKSAHLSADPAKARLLVTDCPDRLSCTSLPSSIVQFTAAISCFCFSTFTGHFYQSVESAS